MYDVQSRWKHPKIITNNKCVSSNESIVNLIYVSMFKVRNVLDLHSGIRLIHSDHPKSFINTIVRPYG